MPSGATYNMSGFRLLTTPTSGYYLQTDSLGNGSWAPAPTSIYADGSVSAPSITFTSDSTTGLYLLTGPSVLGFTVGGSQIAGLSAAGLTLPTGRTLSVGTAGTTSPLNVYGLITGFGALTITGSTSLQALTTGGLLTAAAGLTVANGQTLNVGTTGTTSPLNVFGISTLNARLNVVAGGAGIVGAPSTTALNAGFVVDTPAYTTVNTNPVFMSYISGTPIITAGGVPTEAYNLVLANPPTGAADNYNLFADGGRSYMNSGMRYKITTIAATTYTPLSTDFCIIMTPNGAKTLTLPASVLLGAYFIIINAAGNGTISIARNGNQINNANTNNLTVGAGGTLVIFGATATSWFTL